MLADAGKCNQLDHTYEANIGKKLDPSPCGNATDPKDRGRGNQIDLLKATLGIARRRSWRKRAKVKDLLAQGKRYVQRKTKCVHSVLSFIFEAAAMIPPTEVFEVLVVEENPADLYLIKEGFSECGVHCRLTAVSSREEAAEVLTLKRFDVILLDFGTDSVRASEFVRSIRANNRRTPIVVLSASFNIDAAYEAGANAFIRKTADLGVFFRKIKTLMSFWVDTAELPTRSLAPTSSSSTVAGRAAG